MSLVLREMRSNLLYFATGHGATDINHKDHILWHHWKALRCKEVHKVAIDYLESRERQRESEASVPLGVPYWLLLQIEVRHFPPKQKMSLSCSLGGTMQRLSHWLAYVRERDSV